MFRLPDLPYEKSAFAGWLSPESFDFHYAKHHKTYLDKMNSAIEGTDQQKMSLEQIVASSKGGLFNNAAQSWNHTFFWHSITPKPPAPSPQLEVVKAINKTFGSLDEFRAQFTNTAISQFGSGWAWLVKDSGGKLEILSTGNADTPMTQGKIPLLTCDVWEHAYYIDHRNARPKFVEGFLNHINWDFCEKNYLGKDIPNMTAFMK
jgi:superoxide dismutase, Fe-Mn family